MVEDASGYVHLGDEGDEAHAAAAARAGEHVESEDLSEEVRPGDAVGAGGLSRAACVAAARLRVRVEGHSDARGREEYNRWLAWDRAAAVSTYLRERGVPDRRVTTRSAGSSRPLCAEATKDCHARNRRVEVTVR